MKILDRMLGEPEDVTGHRIGTREEADAALEELLVMEKELSRNGDALAEARRDLPWVPIEKEYRFQTCQGTKTLAELFDGRSQLLVDHFRFGPSFEAGCPVCSSSADSVNGVVEHLNARDVTMLYVSRAPLEKLQAYKERMGWSFPWVSSAGSDFNFDFYFSCTEEDTLDRNKALIESGIPPLLTDAATECGTDFVGYASEGFAFSAFVLDEGTVYHTYRTHSRGREFLMGYYSILDRAPKGRGDDPEVQGLGFRRHDEYDTEQVR
jgi:predicted dithiol-disulfide oxidoreductase (DUF899 family)